jgi:hypothetical protein
MEKITETIHLDDGVRLKIGFQEGAWIAKSKDGYYRVAVSRTGQLLYIEYCGCYDERHACAFKLFSNFKDMVADDDIDLELMARTAAALGVEDYVALFDV